LFFLGAVHGLFWEDILWMTRECREKLILFVLCVSFYADRIDVWKGWNGITQGRGGWKDEKIWEEKAKGGMSGAVSVPGSTIYRVGSVDI
jgi:hypothetical protein